MANVEPFEKFFDAYEEWFDRNEKIYRSELNLFRTLMKKTPPSAVEIGVGSGKFAAPLGIPYGIDPSSAMLKIAKRRGVKVAIGVAENLPLKKDFFLLALMVTTICFVDNPLQSFREAARILKRKGLFAVGFVDKNSTLGRRYSMRKNQSKFYRTATFYSTTEIIEIGKKAGFTVERILQTVFGSENRIYPVKEGFGEGSFVGVLFRKP